MTGGEQNDDKQGDGESVAHGCGLSKKELYFHLRNAAATVTDYQNGNGVHLTLTAPPAAVDYLRSTGHSLMVRALATVKRTGQIDIRINPTNTYRS